MSRQLGRVEIKRAKNPKSVPWSGSAVKWDLSGRREKDGKRVVVVVDVDRVEWGCSSEAMLNKICLTEPRRSGESSARCYSNTHSKPSEASSTSLGKDTISF